MKIFTTLALVALTTMCAAQDKKPMDPESMATRQAQDLTTRLKLNEEQSQQLSKALMDAAKETAPLREQCMQIDAKINAAYDKRMNEMMASMTPDQRDTYNKARKEGAISFTSCGAAAGCSADAHAKTGGCSGESKAEAKGACCAGGKAHGEAKPADLAKPSDTGKPAQK